MVAGCVRLPSGASFSGSKLTFQREASRGLAVTYHFTFTGRQPAQATAVIRDRTITVQDGLVGEAQVRLTADSETWLGFVAKERSLIWALLRGKIRVRGPALPTQRAAVRQVFPELMSLEDLSRCADGFS